MLLTYYTQLELDGIHEVTSYLEPAHVDIPPISVEFLDSDQGTRVELENVLNQTEQGQSVYASYWQNLVFLKTLSDVYDFSSLGINILTILVFGIVFICQLRRLVQIQAMILVL